MNLTSKGAQSMRIIALPLARIKISAGAKLKPSDYNANNLPVFYHFDLISPYAGRKDLPTHKKVLKSVINKAADLWTSLGKAPKGSWKLWTYELGERTADQIEFEELALRSVDPSLGPTVPTRTSAKTKDQSQSHALPKVCIICSNFIPLIYPPSLYPAGADHALYPPVEHLRTLLANRGPRHRRGFYLWMLIAPLTLPIMLIPIIPNLPLFFCVWRSWSHYKAYRSSHYLSSLLDGGLVEPNPSLELDRLYAPLTLSSRISASLPPLALASKSSEKTSNFGNDAADKKSGAASGTGSSRSECILLTREVVHQILEMFRLPGSTIIDIHRATKQVHARCRG
ncbi:mitochondrial K+-H+ exchange-related-domain-containing protein [Boletus edulis BED1]|uniref:Mitochondrial K+-H+ exchange-related-domain-containing protein n=1 Tax=Boletus edulis BED1 TaxID=1328754 RepID=A0AAD4BYK2_BOLED|nr:mitochondrial K+-H+ exchange-related-domain-containing protein [Boletus edulis BED1]